MSGYRVSILRNRVCFLTGIVLYFSTVVPSEITAAGITGGMTDIFRNEYRNQAGIFNISDLHRNEESSSAGSMIDNSIDEDAYMIGMGDVFHISVIETPSISYTATVNQNGDVRINEFGILTLGKISLREAKTRIGEFVGKKLTGRDSVYVTLRQGKIASVTVNGGVAKPGIMFVDGVYRVWDCIIKANNGTVPAAQDADLRNVVVKNSDTTLNLDLFRYNVRNDLSQNPYIYPGDRIFINTPLVQVLVLGEVKKPASGSFIPLRPGETVRELFDVLVIDPSADSNMIVLQRGGTKSERHDTVLSMTGDGADLRLEHGDIVNVTKRADYPEVATVAVAGAVWRPGQYTIVEKNTTAKDIIDRCGGYLAKANPDRVYILRNSKKVTGALPENGLEFQAENNVKLNLGSIRQEMNLAFARMNSLQDYSVISLADRGAATILEHGDQLVVPYSEPFVYVSGSVGKPGAYAFVEGKDSRYYIRDAGGFTRKSDRRNVYVLSPYHTSVQVKSDRSIEQGDIIIVPDSQNNKIMITFIMPVLQVASTVATIILAMVSVIQASN